jgi:hypothetical protein
VVVLNAKPRMPCLAKATIALLATKPGLGGLECDFGNLNDIITPKITSLGGGFAEALMMLKLNKHLMPYDHENVILLDNSNWKNHIPKRPISNEELQIEDDDGSLVENGEQQKLDINEDE